MKTRMNPLWRVMSLYCLRLNVDQRGIRGRDMTLEDILALVIVEVIHSQVLMSRKSREKKTFGYRYYYSVSFVAG